ncbi:hypothetical protein A2926_00725 [Candidatus Giovannonibacteria bacterium RIFCSPLOWO2_01_FULL_44_40]|uniref:Uncharacterized protein n=1 Tax=Candidatus Giovannonibacteria bacterium RIFCSPHIGHO2_01_FULL_45_23 TaxID=1798325 RepID=A0A1F5VER0_9BACT|nr:MAG: hypothetical protein A2834_00230 [Candidatus Giovannonibacteria bacterium RIFCSPHIGHO2_01_FULL_45_23]OGF76476.1 MAG: hypothetical protein A3C77_02940 [Candidatus Giovannonibacteria bacterium RIFCSPHIGHO2_02_FULL_45_13]OGF79603.1 MAG: hypothetical protein A2926_00725 [Candidatus Giovannonibacteria bacterium RIFCSPLOWO2_01_FULL_44_40]
MTKKSKKLQVAPMMEQGLALKLIDSVVKRCFKTFSVQAESPAVLESIQKKFREEVVLAIAEVYAIVPDGYKLDKKTIKLVENFLKKQDAENQRGK